MLNKIQSWIESLSQRMFVLIAIAFVGSFYVQTLLFQAYFPKHFTFNQCMDRAEFSTKNKTALIYAKRTCQREYGKKWDDY